MGNFLFTSIIYPLKMIIEFFYGLGMYITNNEGISIIGVSVCITLLCLPLYNIAESWQQIERDTQKRLQPGIDRIKKSFKGDEQYMILSTYYKENKYKPIYALRSSFGLLIQIPFFIAAYYFLSHLTSLQGVSFLFIKDLSKPDEIIHIGKFGVNILPIAMTVINCISGAVYTKGFKLKDKLQLYIMALLFLVLLYTSPSGLVLYWTMNNIFSLVKNIFYKLKNPKKAFLTMLTVIINIGLPVLLIYLKSKKWTVLMGTALVCMDALLICIKKQVFKNTKSTFFSTIYAKLYDNDAQRFLIFFFSEIALCILIGLLIPSNIIVSSTQEFSLISKDVQSPYYFIFNSLLQSIGLCILWPTCLYLLFDKRIKTYFSIFFILIVVTACINNFMFSGNSGLISTMFIFDHPENLNFGIRKYAINVIALLLFCSIVLLLFRYVKLQYILCLICIVNISLIGVITYNTKSISRDYKQYKKNFASNNTKINSNNKIEKIFHFSKTGKNVLVIMLDRAVNGFIPFIF